MLFVDYAFDVLENGTIVMDAALTADKLKLKNGDKYIAEITFDGRIILQKVSDDEE
jgi:hypothetical protein